MPTQLEIDEARARWRELAAEDAGLGPIAAFHDERLAQLAARPAFDVSVDITPADAEAAIADGTPLLARGNIAIETDEVAREFTTLARNLSETAEPRTAAADTATRLAHAPIDLGPLLESALSGDAASIEKEAFRLGVDAIALGNLLDLALQPALWEAVTQLQALTDIDRWERGYCPVCGAWPTLAELVGTERRRVLRCGRCGSGWSWLVLLCPYCGNDDHRTLGSLMGSDEAGERRSTVASKVDTCEACRGYVKAISTFDTAAAARLAAEDVATVHLDLAAKDAGYARPGRVDVATAGIPRLLRESAG